MQISLFGEQMEASEYRPSNSKQKIKLLTREIIKEFEKYAPISSPADQAVDMVLEMLKTKYSHIDPDTILWVIGNMMKDILNKMDGESL